MYAVGVFRLSGTTLFRAEKLVSAQIATATTVFLPTSKRLAHSSCDLSSVPKNSLSRARRKRMFRVSGAELISDVVAHCKDQSTPSALCHVQYYTDIRNPSKPEPDNIQATQGQMK